MADERFYVRRTDGSGGGVIFKTEAERKAWLKVNPAYEAVERADIDADQRAADEAVAAKAKAEADDKAVRAPRRN